MTLFETVPRVVTPDGIPAATETPWTLERLGPPALAFVVHGDPAPQGSKSFKGMRKSKTHPGVMVPVLKESSAAKVDRWRADVVAAALRVLPGGWQRLAEDNRDGVVLDLVLTRNRPQALPKTRLCWPAGQPDLDKFARSTGDALTTAGVYADDARVVSYRRLDKVYVGADDPDALPHPGAVIRIWALRGSAYDIAPIARRGTR